MPLLNSLCCGCRSRKTSLITAFYSISMAVTCLSLMLLQHSASKQHTYVKDPTFLSYLSLGVYGLLIVSSFVLVAGANLSKLCVSIPWFLNMVAVVGFEAATSGTQYVMAYHQHKHLRPWDIFCVLFYTLRTFCNVYFMASICVQCYCSLNSTEIEEDGEEKSEGSKDVYTIEETRPPGAATHATLKFPNGTNSDHLSQASPLYQRLPVDIHRVPDRTISQLGDMSSIGTAENAEMCYREDHMTINVEPLLESYSGIQKSSVDRNPTDSPYQVTARKRGQVPDDLPLCSSSARYAEHSFETTPLYQRHPGANPDDSPWHNPAVGEEESAMLIASEEEVRYDGLIETFDIDTL